MTEVIGIDHIYVTVSDLVKSEQFYDRVLGAVLGFRKNEFVIGGDRHIQYFNRHFGFVLRPARVNAAHEPYSAGLHHFCFRVESKEEVQAVAEELRKQRINATQAKVYSHYAPDYVATFFEDPDGIRLEVTNYRQERRDRRDFWDEQISRTR
jgi:catechol 2,3-dioxygenase-like lactoylglutathione lyase family enzyme